MYNYYIDGSLSVDIHFILTSFSWAMELNINPSEHTPFVFLSVALSSIVLGAIIIGLSIRERRQDQKERKRAIMMLNFDAL